MKKNIMITIKLAIILFALDKLFIKFSQAITSPIDKKCNLLLLHKEQPQPQQRVQLSQSEQRKQPEVAPVLVNTNAVFEEEERFHPGYWRR